MLNKFENADAELPREDPRFAVMEGWATVNYLYRTQFFKISSLMGSFYWENRERKQDPDFTFAAELEARLQSEFPELVTALNQLRSALDKVAGWHITWRHYERGEVLGLGKLVDVEVEGVEEGVMSANVVRGPAQYHLNEGWIVGSQVGVDRVFGGINAWIEINDEPYKQRGINFQLGEMHAIELSPPE